MEDSVKTYYESMVEKGTELLAEMKAMATTVELEDDATGIKYRMGMSGGTMYFEELAKETVVPDTGGGSEESGGEPTDNTEQEVTE